MKIVRRMLGAALVAVTAVSLVSMEPVSASTGTDELAFAAKLNELRVSQGLRPLETKGALFDVGRAWSTQMLAADAISHNPSLAAQAPGNWARLGENVGVGYDVQSLHNAFVNSPAHYKNMIDPAFDSVGVGVVHAADGKIFVTVAFMTTRTPVAAPAKPNTRQVCTKNRRGKVTCRVVRAR